MGRSDNPSPTRFLGPIDCLKIPAPEQVPDDKRGDAQSDDDGGCAADAHNHVSEQNQKIKTYEQSELRL